MALERNFSYKNKHFKFRLEMYIKPKLIKIKQEDFSNQLYTKKKSYLTACLTFFIHSNIFPDYICLYIETSIHDFKFSLAHTFKKARLIEFELRKINFYIIFLICQMT